MEERNLCELDRRGFLKSCSFVAAAALAAGATGASAQALPTRWTNALEGDDAPLTYPLPATDGVEIDRDHSVMLTRYHDHVYAFSMICPHQRAAVKWLDDKQIFQCTKHKSKYTEDGIYVSGRATRSLDRFPIRIDGAKVIVDVDNLLREDKDAAGWKAAAAHI